MVTLAAMSRMDISQILRKIDIVIQLDTMHILFDIYIYIYIYIYINVHCIFVYLTYMCMWVCMCIVVTFKWIF